MAASMVSAASAGRHRRRRRAVMSEINVTPFVDVMLVLLIVFMVSAPLMVNLIPINLPEARSGDAAKDLGLQIGVTVKKTSGSCSSQFTLALTPAQEQGGTPVDLDNLEEMVKRVRDSSPAPVSPSVRLSGDKDVCYSDIMRVLGELKDAGFGTDIAVLPERDHR
ncbi:MAG TPA: biopolymer transporter ExbD [Xanthobacteraceae bacterium]|nr:biopolymer transporter ExbD [Xanthobacteraceae bacterium]